MAGIKGLILWLLPAIRLHKVTNGNITKTNTKSDAIKHTFKFSLILAFSVSRNTSYPYRNWDPYPDRKKLIQWIEI